eukprot:scaffold2696_cov144-Skeletonema_marinoi.AAC.9
MSGYSNVYHATENDYGIMAYNHIGSAEQQKLVGLGVCFNPVKFKAAIERRTTKRLRERQDQRGIREDVISGNFWDMMNSFT